jgi:hypothetical protein
MGLIILFYLCSRPRISASKTKPLCSILSSKGYSQHPYPIFIHSLTIQLAFLPLLCYCHSHWSIDSRSLDYTLARPLWDPALIFINVSHPAILFAICGSIQQSYVQPSHSQLLSLYLLFCTMGDLSFACLLWWWWRYADWSPPRLHLPFKLPTKM